MTKFLQWLELYGQSRLAKDLGSSRQLVNSWVKGDTRPSDQMKDKIIKLSNHLLDYNDFYK